MNAKTQEDTHEIAARATTSPNEVLTVRLGAEEYGIDILHVQEIRSLEQPTRIAGTPLHVQGVTNLRGVIVPIIDLRSRLALDAAFSSGTVTVVLDVGGRTVGPVADAVSDVAQLGETDIAPFPKFSRTVAANHTLGIATLDQAGFQRKPILVDIEQPMTSHAMGLVDAALH